MTELPNSLINRAAIRNRRRNPSNRAYRWGSLLIATRRAQVLESGRRGASRDGVIARTLFTYAELVSQVGSGTRGGVPGVRPWFGTLRKVIGQKTVV